MDYKVTVADCVPHHEIAAPKLHASATPLSNTEWLVTDVDSTRRSLFTLAIVLVHISNLDWFDEPIFMFWCL